MSLIGHDRLHVSFSNEVFSQFFRTRRFYGSFLRARRIRLTKRLLRFLLLVLWAMRLFV